MAPTTISNHPAGSARPLFKPRFAILTAVAFVFAGLIGVRVWRSATQKELEIKARGEVWHKKNNTPISGAEVHLIICREEGKTKTNAEGYFDIECNVPEQETNMRARITIGGKVCEFALLPIGKYSWIKIDDECQVTVEPGSSYPLPPTPSPPPTSEPTPPPPPTSVPTPPAVGSIRIVERTQKCTSVEVAGQAYVRTLIIRNLRPGNYDVVCVSDQRDHIGRVARSGKVTVGGVTVVEF